VRGAAANLVAGNATLFLVNFFSRAMMTSVGRGKKYTEYAFGYAGVGQGRPQSV